MRKGFDYWASKRIPSFLRIYWIGFALVFSTALTAAIILRNPIIFAMLGLLPYPVLLIFRVLHRPFLNLEENLKRIDPSFCELLVQKSEEIRTVMRILTSESKCREGRIRGALLNWGKDAGLDQRIVAFKRNIKRFVYSSMLTLSLWFLTWLLLLLILFFTGLNP